MTTIQKRNIVKKLIKYYEEAINEVKKLEFSKAMELTSELNIHLGVCCCALSIFNICVYGEEFILLYSKGPSWYKNPISAKTKKQLLKRLQVRLDNLNLILEKKQYKL